MRVTRLYHPEKISCGETCFLNTDNSNHLVRVLRSKNADPVILFNGDGYNYQCKIIDANNKKTLVEIESRAEALNESNLHITLIQGLSRQDRMETSIQKSVELGVNRIIPIVCQRSNLRSNKEKLAKKLEHWRKVVVSACEQSGRCKIPEISDIITLDEIDDYLRTNSISVTLNPTADIPLRDIALDIDNSPVSAINVFIGPEGGLSNDEISLLEDKKFKNVSFGPRILRTETAGPAVISALQTLWGDI